MLLPTPKTGGSAPWEPGKLFGQGCGRGRGLGQGWGRGAGVPCRLEGLGSELGGQGSVPGGLGRGLKESSQEAGESGLIENTLWRPAHQDCCVGACCPLRHPLGASSQAPVPAAEKGCAREMPASL